MSGELFVAIPFIASSSEIIESKFVPHLLFLSKFKSGSEPVPCNPNQLIKFDSTSFIPLPADWKTSSEVAAVRNNATTSGQLKIVTITGRGVGYGTAATYNNFPLLGGG